MISQAGWLTQTPSATPLQTKKWNAHILIMFNFWWLARLVIGLEPHPPLLSRQKKWNASFWITFTSDDLPGWLMNLNLICHPSLTKKNEMHNFWLRSTSDDQPSWSIDLKSICQPSQANKMKCSFFGYVQLLMISRAVQWTQTPSATPLQPIKWNAHFWITFNFWWSARLVNGLEPHPSPLSSQKKMKYLFLDCIHFWWSAWLIDELEPHIPPLSYQKNEMLNFWLHSTSNHQPGWSMDSNPICHPSPAKKMKCLFLYYIQLLMLARLVNRLKPHPPSLCSQKNEMLLLWITLNF